MASWERQKWGLYIFILSWDLFGDIEDREVTVGRQSLARKPLGLSIYTRIETRLPIRLIDIQCHQKEPKEYFSIYTDPDVLPMPLIDIRVLLNVTKRNPKKFRNIYQMSIFQHPDPNLLPIHYFLHK